MTNSASPKAGAVKKIAYLYKYLDPDGGYHYTDEPKGNYRLISKTKVEVHYDKEETKTASTFHKFSGTPVFPSYNFDYTAGKSKFNDLIADAAARYQLDEKLLHAVIQTESAYNAGAVSPAGAVGLMQLMPGTAERYGVADRKDPVQNIHGGAHYLRDLLDMFSPNIDLAIAAYNAGENAVLKYNYTIPPYSETQNYVRQVLARYNH
ncbi:lytic transglycosylase domain-containing protein [Methylosoma difficile]